jgi:MFS family permease
LIENLAFGIGSICFTLALVPAVLKRQPPPLFSCALTGFWLWVFCACYVGLGFAFSAITGACTAVMWTILGFQAWRLRRAPEPTNRLAGMSITGTGIPAGARICSCDPGCDCRG